MTLDAATTALQWAHAIRHREVSATEVATFYLERAQGAGAALNAFSHLAPEDTLAAAERADAMVAAAREPSDLPPFLGVPLPIKNLNPVKGWPCTYGSRGASRAPRECSDPIVERLESAGFVLSGMTNSPEFGTISFTESEAHGTTHNPWNPAHTPGGSSGGAGAAVAAGLAPLAHGSDGGGSIRIPASCNGLVGHKPSRALVPNEFVEIEGFVSEHVLTRDVADCAAVLDVLAVVDPLVFFSAPRPSTPYAELAVRPPGALRVGFTTSSVVDLPVDPACVRAVERAVEALEGLGHQVQEVTLGVPDQDAFISAFTDVWNTGSVWSPVEDWDAIESLNTALRAAAQATDSLKFAASVRGTQRMVRPILAPFGRDYDVLVTPTMACLPPTVGAWREGMDVDPVMGLLNCYPMAVFTSVFNVTGQPATSVPVHHDVASGLPVGVQVVAGPWQDHLCLQVAAQLEVALPWGDRRPPGF